MANVSFGENTTNTYGGVTKDAYVNDGSGQNTNYGDVYRIILKDGSPSGLNRYGHLGFNLAAVAGANVTAATLKVVWHAKSAGFNSMHVYFTADNRDWVELEVTWNIYKTGSNWTAGGGDFGDYINEIDVSSAVEDDIISIPLTGDALQKIQDALDGSGNPTNWISFSFDAGQALVDGQFFTKDEAQDGRRPVLELTVDSVPDPTASIEHSIHIQGFPAPMPGYNRENEAQFRRGLERTLVEVVGYFNRVAADPGAFAPHKIADAFGLGSQHTTSGLTVGHVLRANSAADAAFNELQHADLGGVTSDQHHAQSHVLATEVGLGADHTMSGATAGYVLRASAATAAAFAQLQHADLGGVGIDDHHARDHDIDGVTHTASGLTAGHFLKALTATTFGFAAHGLTAADVGAAATSHTHDAADVVSGAFANARIAESNVTNHQAALSIAFTQVTGVATDAQLPSEIAYEDEANTFSLTQTIENTAPGLKFRETDQSLPDGLWRILGSGNRIKFQLNTAVAGDFSTLNNVIELVSNGKLIVLGDTQFNGVQYTWPGADGASGEILSTNGAGVLSWSAAGMGGTGTVGTIPKFTAATTLGDSVITESGGNITIGGALTAATGVFAHNAALAVAVRNSTSGVSYLHLQNSTTGSSATDGMVVGLNSVEQALVWNYENTSLKFGVNNTLELEIASGGAADFQSNAVAMGALTATTVSLSSYVHLTQNNYLRWVDGAGTSTFGLTLSSAVLYIGARSSGAGALSAIRFRSGANTDVAVLSASDFRPNSAGQLTLGTESVPWGTAWVGGLNATSVTVTSGTPTVVFDETDGVGAAGLFRFAGAAAGDLRLQMNTAAGRDFSTVQEVFGVAASGNILIGITTDAGPKVYMSESDASAGGLELRINNTSTATASVSIINLRGNNGTVSALWYADGLGTGPLGTAGTYFGNYTNHPVGFFTNNTERMRVTAGGALFINETSNAKQDHGVTVTLDVGDSIREGYVFKHTSVAHGMTTVVETDTVGSFGGLSIDGGLFVEGFTEQKVGAAFSGVATIGDTTKSSAGDAAVELEGYKKSGTTRGGFAANENVMAVRANGSALLILDAEGDLHVDGSSSLSTFDEHDDVRILRGMRAALMDPADPRRAARAADEAYARTLMEPEGVVTYNTEGPNFVALKKALYVTWDAVGQVFDRGQAAAAAIEGRMRGLENRLAALENAGPPNTP